MCTYIYRPVCLIRLDEQADGWGLVGIVNSSPIGWWHAPVFTGKRSSLNRNSEKEHAGYPCYIIVPFYPGFKLCFALNDHVPRGGVLKEETELLISFYYNDRCAFIWIFPFLSSSSVPRDIFHEKIINASWSYVVSIHWRNNVNACCDEHERLKRKRRKDEWNMKGEKEFIPRGNSFKTFTCKLARS